MICVRYMNTHVHVDSVRETRQCKPTTPGDMYMYHAFIHVHTMYMCRSDICIQTQYLHKHVYLCIIVHSSMCICCACACHCCVVLHAAIGATSSHQASCQDLQRIFSMARYMYMCILYMYCRPTCTCTCTGVHVQCT